MDLWQIAGNILLVFLFVFLNGFFVAAEFAIVKVRFTQIEQLINQGEWRAKVVRHLIMNLDSYLSAVQLGITMTSLALGWLGEPFVAAMLRPGLVLIGMYDTALQATIAFAIAFSVITALHIVIGELAPKSLAIRKPVETSLIIATPLRLFHYVFSPVIGLLNGCSNLMLRIVGIDAPPDAELRHSQAELRMLFAQDTETSPASKKIVLNALDFRRKQARHCMKPRKEILALSLNDPVKENIETMRANKYSRYPVYRDSLDNIIGVVHTKDIFKPERHLKPDFMLQSVLRDAIFFPETVTLERILEEMLRKKSHMVLLADEYGSTAGLITLEDILEELVGRIQDEYDKETPEIVQVNADEWVIDAALTTDEVERLLGRELSPMDIRSIGGLVIEQLGHLPQAGEQTIVNGVEMIVEKTEERTIESIRIRRLPLEEKAEEEPPIILPKPRARKPRTVKPKPKPGSEKPEE